MDHHEKKKIEHKNVLKNIRINKRTKFFVRGQITVDVHVK